METETKEKETENATNKEKKKYGPIKAPFITLSNYDIGETINNCNLGNLKMSQNIATGEYLLIKVCNKKNILKEKVEYRLEREIKILLIIDHPFTIKFQGLTQDEKNVYLAFELINGTEMFTLLRSVGTFSEDQAKMYIAQIILALEYLHEKNIIYRDIKPEHLLINKNGYLKLIDFSFSKILVGKTFTLSGTPEYLAPEIVLNKGHGKPVDWWTCGILLYEMLAGIDPFNNDDPMIIYENIIAGKINYPSSFDSCTKDLITNLLQQDPSKRLGSLENGVNDIKNHDFFKDLDWDKLLKMELAPPYIPNVKGDGDLSNFPPFPNEEDDNTDNTPLNKENDIFLDWFI